MIIAAGLSKFLWAEAVHHSIWLGVHTLSHVLPEFVTPFEIAIGCKLNLKGVFKWGILIWIKRIDAGKLNPDAIESQFIGYNEEAKGYHIYWTAKQFILVKHDIYIDRDAMLEPGDVIFEGGELPSPNPNSINDRHQVTPSGKAEYASLCQIVHQNRMTHLKHLPKTLCPSCLKNLPRFSYWFSPV